jgi:hypothetical protein
MLMSQWNKSTIVASVAVLVTISSLTFSSISDSVATTANHSNRLDSVEYQVKTLAPIIKLTPVLSSQMKDISSNLNLMRNAYNRQSRGLEDNVKRISSLEITTAVTTKAMNNLTLAVGRLSTDTRELSRITTSVEVIGAKLEALTESTRRSYQR